MVADREVCVPGERAARTSTVAPSCARVTSSASPVARVARVACAVTAAFVVSACAVDGLDFVVDDRVDIVSLDDREETDVPIELVWTFAGPFEGDEAAFAVIVDRTPPPPGRNLEAMLEDDDACDGPLGCPDGYLERNRIYVTTETSIVLDNIAEGTAAQEDRGYHEVTIVIVDEAGDRVGELAESVRFRLPGRDR